MNATLTPGIGIEQAPPLASDPSGVSLDQRSETISYPTGLVAALRRNNLRALHLAVMDSVCAWTTEACHRSQAAHGRGDDCGWHPHSN